jgi:hypothetical protein
MKGTKELRLHYTKTNIFQLTCYVHGDWCWDIEDKKSTLGYKFFMGGYMSNHEILIS